MPQRTVNYAAGVLQLVLSLALLVWFVQELHRGDVDESGLSFPMGEYNGALGERAPMATLPVAALVLPLCVFTLVTGAMHLLYARRDKSYQGSVDGGSNWMRWAEYSVTATIMLCVVAILSGVAALDSLVLIAVATMCCMACGYLSERTATTRKRVSKLATLVGWLLMGACFFVILRRFGSVYAQTSGAGEPGPPWFVWAILVSMLVLFSSFGVIHLAHMRHQWRAPCNAVDLEVNRRADTAYTTASMVSKTLLVVLTAAGLYAR